MNRMAPGPQAVRIPLFADLPKDDQDLLLRKAQRRTYRPEETIFREGDPPSFIYHVLSGEVNLSLSSDERRISVGKVPAGRLLGLLGLFDDGPHYLAATAMAPTTILAIPKDDVVTALRRHPELLLRLVGLMARQTRAAAFLIAEMQFLDLPVRLAKRLLELAEARAGHSGGELHVKITQKELSELAGATRGGVNRALKRLEDLGIIDTGRGRLRILSPEKLRRLAARQGASLPALLGLEAASDGGA